MDPLVPHDSVMPRRFDVALNVPFHWPEYPLSVAAVGKAHVWACTLATDAAAAKSARPAGRGNVAFWPKQQQDTVSFYRCLTHTASPLRQNSTIKLLILQ